MKNILAEKKFLIALGLYTVLHFCFRIFISRSLEKDEAEMVLYLQQSFSWGYNSQPPLYVWLQLAFFRLLGAGVVALALLKNLLIFFFYFFLYKSAKIILNNTTKAIIGTTSLVFIYNFSWIMHKDLTHSVLLMALSSLTFYIFLKVLTGPKPRLYVVLGICLGLGMISKYNFIIFAAALGISTLSIPQYRKIIYNRNTILTLVAASIVISGHFWWAIHNIASVTSDTGDFQASDGTATFLGIKGLLALLEQIFLLIIPLVVIYAGFFPKALSRFFKKTKEKNNISIFLGRFFIFFLVITLLLVILGNVGKIKARWLGPFIFLIPIYFFTKTGEFKINPKRKIAIFSLVIFCAVATLFSVWGRIILASTRGKYNRLNYPYSQLSTMIREEGFRKGLIIAEDQVIAANLKLYFKDSFAVVAQNQFNADIIKYFDQVLIIWEDHISKSYDKSFEKIIKYYNLQDKTPLKKEALFKYSRDSHYYLKMFIVKNINI
jgi:4-amino-4-deoxy-L-arabinose transferase-like glycosyltransferase